MKHVHLLVLLQVLLIGRTLSFSEEKSSEEFDQGTEVQMQSSVADSPENEDESDELDTPWMSSLGRSLQAQDDFNVIGYRILDTQKSTNSPKQRQTWRSLEDLDDALEDKENYEYAKRGWQENKQTSNNDEIFSLIRSTIRRVVQDSQKLNRNENNNYSNQVAPTAKKSYRTQHRKINYKQVNSDNSYNKKTYNQNNSQKRQYQAPAIYAKSFYHQSQPNIENVGSQYPPVQPKSNFKQNTVVGRVSSSAKINTASHPTPRTSSSNGVQYYSSDDVTEELESEETAVSIEDSTHEDDYFDSPEVNSDEEDFVWRRNPSQRLRQDFSHPIRIPDWRYATQTRYPNTMSKHAKTVNRTPNNPILKTSRVASQYRIPPANNPNVALFTNQRRVESEEEFDTAEDTASLEDLSVEDDTILSSEDKSSEERIVFFSGIVGADIPKLPIKPQPANSQPLLPSTVQTFATNAGTSTTPQFSIEDDSVETTSIEDKSDEYDSPESIEKITNRRIVNNQRRLVTATPRSRTKYVGSRRRPVIVNESSEEDSHVVQTFRRNWQQPNAARISPPSKIENITPVRVSQIHQTNNKKKSLKTTEISNRNPRVLSRPFTATTGRRITSRGRRIQSYANRRIDHSDEESAEDDNSNESAEDASDDYSHEVNTHRQRNINTRQRNLTPTRIVSETASAPGMKSVGLTSQQYSLIRQRMIQFLRNRQQSNSPSDNRHTGSDTKARVVGSYHRPTPNETREMRRRFFSSSRGRQYRNRWDSSEERSSEESNER